MMNSELNKELVHGIALAMVDNHWTRQEYMVFISLNKWMTDEFFYDIERHAIQAEKIITLAAKQHIRETRSKHKALEPHSEQAIESDSTMT